jgi:hypothetical protein
MLSATQSNTWSIVIQAWLIGWYLLGALLLGYRGEHL